MRKLLVIDMSELQGEGAQVQCRVPTVGAVLEFLTTDGSYEAGAKLVADHVTSWNLADEEGKPLEAPAGDPAKVSKLTAREFRMVVDTLLNQTEKTKN